MRLEVLHSKTDFYTRFFLSKKKEYINFVPKLVCRPSVTFLVNVSPFKPLDVATSNFVYEYVI